MFARYLLDRVNGAKVNFDVYSTIIASTRTFGTKQKTALPTLQYNVQ